MQSCGGCCHFIKWRERAPYLRKTPLVGLCDVKDARTSSDGGRACSAYKGIKYKRHIKRQYDQIALREVCVSL